MEPLLRWCLLALCGALLVLPGCGCPTFENTDVPTCGNIKTSRFNRAGRGTVREAPGCPDNCQWNPYEFTPDGPYEGLGTFKTVLIDTYSATCEATACSQIKEWPTQHDETTHKPPAQELCQNECRDRGLTFLEVALLKKDNFHADHEGDCEPSCCPSACNNAVQRHMMWACVCQCQSLPCHP